MDDWFTIEKIDQDTYAISEYKHWEETHCYLLLGSTSSFIIDTGLGVKNIRIITDALTTLPITAAATHIHWDHIGGFKYYPNLAVHAAEEKWLSAAFPVPLPIVKASLFKEPCDFPPEFDIEKYQITPCMPSIILHDRDIIDLGNRKVEVIHTPGHSPGHICFYEEDRGYLYSGDLIYSGTLYAFYPTTDPVDFMQSVKKVKSLPVTKLLPAHHSLSAPVCLIDEINNGFSELFDSGKLKQGNGIFTFPNFSIYI